MFRRIILFVLVNILVVATISTILALLGVDGYLSESGIDYQSLLIFCAGYGFLGAFISLALSRVMAKWMMRVQVIDPQNPGSADAKSLLQLVHRLAQKAGMTTMPEVGYYESAEVNAFATGPSKNRALVAVSSGLLNRMDSQAVEGVLGHEISHITNGDMVTMTLLQGVINTFVMFIARVAGWLVTQAMSGRDRDERPSYFMYYMVTQLFEIVLGLFGMMVLAYFSRWREYRADAGSARLAGREKMIHALQSLKSATQLVDDSHPSVATLKINGHPKGFLALFATHPDLDDRINALRSATS